jgi:hypothetical protein
MVELAPQQERYQKTLTFGCSEVDASKTEFRMRATGMWSEPYTCCENFLGRQIQLHVTFNDGTSQTGQVPVRVCCRSPHTPHLFAVNTAEFVLILTLMVVLQNADKWISIRTKDCTNPVIQAIVWEVDDNVSLKPHPTGTGLWIETDKERPRKDPPANGIGGDVPGAGGATAPLPGSDVAGEAEEQDDETNDQVAEPDAHVQTRGHATGQNAVTPEEKAEKEKEGLKKLRDRHERDYKKALPAEWKCKPEYNQVNNKFQRWKYQPPNATNWLGWGDALKFLEDAHKTTTQPDAEPPPRVGTTPAEGSSTPGPGTGGRNQPGMFCAPSCCGLPSAKTSACDIHRLPLYMDVLCYAGRGRGDGQGGSAQRRPNYHDPSVATKETGDEDEKLEGIKKISEVSAPKEQWSSYCCGIAKSKGWDMVETI